MKKVIVFLTSGLFQSILIGTAIIFLTLVYSNTIQTREILQKKILAESQEIPPLFQLVSNDIKKTQHDIFQGHQHLIAINELSNHARWLKDLHEVNLKQLNGGFQNLRNFDIVDLASAKWEDESPLGLYPVPERAQRFKTIPPTLIETNQDEQILRFMTLYDKYEHDYSEVMDIDCTKNSQFSCADSLTLYFHIRNTKPKTVVQIGSSYSVMTVHRALRRNHIETGVKPRHVCVSCSFATPIPEVEVIKSSVLDVPYELFESLGSGDLLFIEQARIVQKYGETIFEFAFLLPMLKGGVHVQFHDIHLPDDYPKEIVTTQKRQYTGQWLLGLFLYGNTQWTVNFWNKIIFQQQNVLELQLVRSLKSPPGVYPSSLYIHKRN